MLSCINGAHGDCVAYEHRWFTLVVLLSSFNSCVLEVLDVFTVFVVLASLVAVGVIVRCLAADLFHAIGILKSQLMLVLVFPTHLCHVYSCLMLGSMICQPGPRQQSHKSCQSIGWP